MIIFLMMLLVMGVTFPESSLAGDAMPGMASQGIVRLPVTGMVEQTFGSVRIPRMDNFKGGNESHPTVSVKPPKTLISDSVEDAQSSGWRPVQKMEVVLGDSLVSE